MTQTPSLSGAITPMSVPIATVLVLADLQPLADRIRSVLSQLSAAAAESLEEEIVRCGRAVLFRGDPAEGLQLARVLASAGLTTSVNAMV